MKDVEERVRDEVSGGGAEKGKQRRRGGDPVQVRGQARDHADTRTAAVAIRRRAIAFPEHGDAAAVRRFEVVEFFLNPHYIGQCLTITGDQSFEFVAGAFEFGAVGQQVALDGQGVRRWILLKIGNVGCQLGKCVLVVTAGEGRGQSRDYGAGGADDGGFFKQIEERFVVGPGRALAAPSCCRGSRSTTASPRRRRSKRGEQRARAEPSWLPGPRGRG